MDKFNEDEFAWLDDECPEEYLYDPELLNQWYWEQFEQDMLRKCYRYVTE